MSCTDDMGLFSAWYLGQRNARTAARYSGDEVRPVEIYHVFMGIAVVFWLVVFIAASALVTALVGLNVLGAIVLAVVVWIMARCLYLFLLSLLES